MWSCQLSSKLWWDRDGKYLAPRLSLLLPTLQTHGYFFTSLLSAVSEYNHRILPVAANLEGCAQSQHCHMTEMPAFDSCLQDFVIHIKLQPSFPLHCNDSSPHIPIFPACFLFLTLQIMDILFLFFARWAFWEKSFFLLYKVSIFSFKKSLWPQIIHLRGLIWHSARGTNCVPPSISLWTF